MTEAQPLCSVITVTFRSIRTVARTIDSVHRQSPTVEHVFVDGGSDDGTRELIRARMRPGDVLIAEPDNGISDAMNKGIARARGPYVAILHSDDWFSDDQLAQGIRTLEGPIGRRAGFAFGDVDFYKNDTFWYRERGDPDYARKVARRMPSVPHPSILYRRECLEKVGPFATDLRLAMDYEWLLRSVRMDVRGIYSAGILACMTHEGVSNRRFAATLREVRDVVVANGRPRPLAEAERLARFCKTTLARSLAERAPGLHMAVRRAINPQLN